MAETTTEHCWHFDGHGVSWDDAGGYDSVTCCHCGCKALKRYRYDMRPIPGHGPHVRARLRIEDGVFERGRLGKYPRAPLASVVCAGPVPVSP